MQRDGVVPNAVTYLSILNPSASNVRALKWVKEIHAQAHKAGLEMNAQMRLLICIQRLEASRMPKKFLIGCPRSF
jgi:hypothetical protein